MDPPRQSALSLLQLAEEMHRAAKEQCDMTLRQEETIRQLRQEISDLVQENEALRRALKRGGAANGTGPEEGVSRVQRAASEGALLRTPRDRTTVKSPSSSSWVNSPLTENNDNIILPAVTVTNMRGGSGSQELDSGLATPSLTSNDSSSRLVSAANITVTPDTASMTSVDSNGSVAYGSRRRPSRSLDDCVVFTRSAVGESNEKWDSSLQPPAINIRRSLQTGTGPERSRPTGIALSFDMQVQMEQHVVRDICRDYGQTVARCQRSARVIQGYYRQYRLSKRVHALRSARRSGMFRRSSEKLVVASSSALVLPSLQHLQAVRERAENTSPSHRGHDEEAEEEEEEVPSSVTSEATPLSATQFITFDEQVVKSDGRLSPTGYAADNSSLSSALSMESVLSVTDVQAPTVEVHQMPSNTYTAQSSFADKNSVLHENIVCQLQARPPTRSQGYPSSAAGASSTSDVHSQSSPPVRRGSFCYEVRNPVSVNGSQEDSGLAKTRKQRKLRIGITHFNRKPAKGIAYLVSKRLLNQDPKDVALFLKKQGGLSREMVGVYLGNLQDPFCQAVLREFVNSFKFDTLTFVQSLRKFLSAFRIPGEAQKIERILEMFADRYASCNPSGPVTNPDTVFILAFSTIMLNTDLHNASVKNRMTKEGFVKNNRGIDDGRDLPRDFLEEIYDNISEREFATPKDHILQVVSLQKSMMGSCPDLVKPHRQLVHVGRFFEIFDMEKKQAAAAHSRFLFLFNDMMVIAKYAPRKNLNTHYVYKTSFPLLDVKVEEFSNQFYKYGIVLRTAFDGKIIACFHGDKEPLLKKFVGDLKEVLLERIWRSCHNGVLPKSCRRKSLAVPQTVVSRVLDSVVLIKALTAAALLLSAFALRHCRVAIGIATDQRCHLHRRSRIPASRVLIYLAACEFATRRNGVIFRPWLTHLKDSESTLIQFSLSLIAVEKKFVSVLSHTQYSILIS